MHSAAFAACFSHLCPAVCVCWIQRRFLEVTVLGLRSLLPYNFQEIHFPSVQFDVGDKSKTELFKYTKNSKEPSGSNPNFLEVPYSCWRRLLDVLMLPPIASLCSAC